MIGARWHAWTLEKGWEQGERDILWAEAIGFKILASYVASLYPQHKQFKIYGDNTGVIEGWQKGHSRNPATNDVFQ